MTQAGRQGSPRNSSGRKGPDRNAPRGAAQGRGAGAGKRDFPKGGERPFGDRTYKGKPREERFVDPDEAPAGRRPGSDWKGGAKAPAARTGAPRTGAPKTGARKADARKPGANRAPGTPGALKPKSGAPKAAGSRAFGSERFGQNLGPVRRPSRARGPRAEVPQSEVHDADGVRLQKVMASAGVASRRVCEEMIAEGRVEVDGKVVTELGVRVDPKTAVIHVDGLRIQLDDTLVYMVFNKPKGVVSTMEDPEGRPCISDYIRNNQGERLFHVGRLDVATEGLLLLTNDGELANRLTHPSYEVPKTYLVQVRGPFPQGIGSQLKDGIELEDGFASVDSFRLVDSTPGHVLIEVVLHSGKNRIVRRLFDAVGFPVLRLVRVKVGPIGLGDQRQGSIRNLGRQEVGHLLASVGL
ncbi:pseudouridine synthase [Arthrobacter sp. AFG20]|uniref:pseudouridine synthase n=1 Tax=Arthrobacter sp. AFG20 TaxID=1688671 RepID=UPI000C9EB0B3|nr:pseudouridine synthase [Arthrobacter sp. AFG20]PNH80467.1 pseudouridine synthase [Arthrobacter sp. AFG20]